MSGKKLALVVIAAIAAVAVAVVMFISHQSASKTDATTGISSSPSDTFVPIPKQTLQGTPSSAPSVSLAPTASPSASVPPSGKVPVVAPELTPITMSDGISGSSDALEKNLTPEEIAVRANIFKVIPVMANVTSPYYKSPFDARDELLSQGLITQNMANTNFISQYSNFQRDLHKTGYTVQTTGLKCNMRTLTPQTALQLGKVSCFFTRHYVDANGAPVSNQAYIQAIGGVGSIDPTQISNVEVSIKQEGGAWKVDDIRFD